MKSKNSSKPCLFGAAFAVATILSAGAAIAKDIPNPTPNNQKSKVDCSQFKLTGKDIVKTIQAIVEHGNLADIPFIEKELNTKFELKNAVESTGINKNRTIYTSETLLEAPVRVFLDVKVSNDKQIYALMRLDSKGTRQFNNCLQITTTEFNSIFGDGFIISALLDSANRQSATKRIKLDNSEISIGYTFNVKEQIIDDIGLSQRP